MNLNINLSEILLFKEMRTIIDFDTDPDLHKMMRKNPIESIDIQYPNEKRIEVRSDDSIHSSRELAKEIANILKKLELASGKERIASAKGREEKGVRKLRAIKTLNFMDAFRKFTNEDNFLVAKILYDTGPLTLSELRIKTGLKTNDLNHSLYSLRGVELALKDDRTYNITNYGAILIEAYNSLASRIGRSSPESLFSSYERTVS